jgi:hypothetical protein
LVGLNQTNGIDTQYLALFFSSTKKEKIETFVISSSPISRSNVFDRMINKKWMKDKKENV